MADEKVFQVSEFNSFINKYLGSIGEVVVEGEISEINISQNKWIFITIKDEENSVEVFGATFKLSNYDLLEEGMLVHVYGKPNLYSKSGKFNISANQIVPAGEGALRLAFEKLKEKLEKEGLFALERKRDLPAFPTQIGLITAKGSSAYHDFVKVLKSRMGGIKIYFYPVTVQGKNSVASIVNALKYFNQDQPNLDLIAMTRGGGSLEDLQSFNDEQVARAVYSSKIPVVTGIGHEDDWTIADLVADVRASTPSNLAEQIVKQRKVVVNKIEGFVKTMEKELKHLLQEKNQKILRSINILKQSINQKILLFENSVDKFKNNFRVFVKQLDNLDKQVDQLSFNLIKFTEIYLREHKQQIDNQVRLLKNMEFKKVLQRGFTITTNQQGKVIKSIAEMNKGEQLTTKLADGTIDSEVIEIAEQ
jgi:exodeoxyribonuclease VII large subunit